MTAQLRWKRQHVVDNLERIGKLRVAGVAGMRRQEVADSEREHGIVVHPTIGMDDPWRYRNKASVPIGMAVDTSAEVQVRARGADRRILCAWKPSDHRYGGVPHPACPNDESSRG